MAENGTLITRVYTSRTQIPISNATVTVIIRNADNTYQVLGERISDQSGNTTPVIIETPAIMASLSPGIPQSYALVEVWADHPNYRSMEIDNIEVFPGVQSIQDIPMIPLMKSELDSAPPIEPDDAQDAPDTTEEPEETAILG